jgi:hypothetical protein
VAAATNQQEINMPEVTQAAQPATNVPFARDKAMNEQILASFRPFADREGVSALQTEVLADPSITVEQANAKLLAKLGESSEPVAKSVPHIEVVADERSKFHAAMTQSILARAGVEKHDTANPFRGHKLASPTTRPQP